MLWKNIKGIVAVNPRRALELRNMAHGGLDRLEQSGNKTLKVLHRDLVDALPVQIIHMVPPQF